MKRAILLLGCAATIACAGSRAAAADELAPASVRVEVQMVSVHTAEALKLVPAFADRKTAEAAWTRVQTMLAEGQSTLLGWPVLWLRNGGHSLTGSVEEYRFATEFNPPTASTIFGPPGGWPPSPQWGTQSPTAFETKDLGPSCDAQARVTEHGQVITINLIPRFVHLLQTRKWQTQRSPIGVEGRMELPEFQTATLTTELSVRQDEPALLGVFVFRRPEPHVELFVLRAKATLIPPASAPPSTK